MLTSEIVIERPPNVVWAFFIEPDNWEKWSRLSLSTARWEVGGSLHFEKGMTSKVEAITPGSTVRFADSWSEETWTFVFSPSGGTTVRVEENPKGMNYSDHGAAAMAKTRKALEKMKDAIENPEEPEEESADEAPAEDEAPPAPAPTPTVPVIPFADDEDDGEGPNPRLRRIPW